VRFAFPRRNADARQRWSALGSTLAWTKYQILVIEHLCNLSSLFWLALLLYYLKFSLRLENGPILYAGYGLFVAASLLTLPYLWIASRCLIGPAGNRVGPLAMLLGGHARWRQDWIEQVVVPNEQLAEKVGDTVAKLQQVTRVAQEQRLRGPELLVAKEKQHQILLDFLGAVPHQWRGGSMLVGRIRSDCTPAFFSENIERDFQLCMAHVVLKTMAAYDQVLFYRDGPTSLVLLLDRRAGRQETKVRVQMTLDKLGGSFQWRFEFATCYFYLPGFVQAEAGVVPSEGDWVETRRSLLGNRWSAPFRLGIFSLLNPLNLFRIVNLLFQGWGYSSEANGENSSIPYFVNHYLGVGDFTDLCLINKLRFDAMGQGKNYRGEPITIPTERTEKETEQLTMSLQQVLQTAIRDALESDLACEPSSIG